MAYPEIATDLEIAPADLKEESRTAILSEMEKLGINTNALSGLTILQLSDLLCGMNKLTVIPHNHNSAAKDRHTLESPASLLSSVDKKLLKELLAAEGSVSMIALSRSLDVPLTTLQRRRKKIEELLIRTYSLNYEKFSMKRITFLLSTEGHSSMSIAKEVLSFAGVTRAMRTLSNAVDLQIDTALRTNKEIADLAEKIKAIKGVRTVSWFESISVVGENKETDLSILSSA